MKKALLAFGMLLMTTSAANAGGLVHKMSSSVQLTVDTARSTATRLGSQYSISGSNVTTSDGTNAGAVTTGCLLYTSPSPRDVEESRMPSSA